MFYKFTFSRCIRVFLATFILACLFQFILIGLFDAFPSKFNFYHAIVQKQQRVLTTLNPHYKTDEELIDIYFKTKENELKHLDKEIRSMQEYYKTKALKNNQTLVQNYHWTLDKLPYFFAKGYNYPDKNDVMLTKLAIWPEETYHDRIVNQMMYIPENYDREELNKKKKLKKILVYNNKGKFSINDIPNGQSKFLTDKCPVNTCEITRDNSRAEKADAIVFKEHIYELNHNRSADQIWIFYTLESPSSISISESRNLINWTATYRLDSDLVTPYAKFVKYDSNENDLQDDLQESSNKTDFLIKKTKKAAWFVSNCGSSNRRNAYAKELNKYYDVDIYGRCGSLRCSRYKSFSCFLKLKNDYKFYLSFENSNCKDYITEKLYLNALQNNIIPIVLGSNHKDYLKQAPTFSFIHVDEFNGVKEMGRFLSIVGQSSKLYNKFFRWLNTGEFVNTFFWCRLCALLHAPIKRKVYKNLDDWWSKDTCDNLKTFKYIKSNS